MPDVFTDSYFGVIGHSFYAGPNGASFEIKRKYGNYRELLAANDANILIGDYVLINYGDQADPDRENPTEETDSPNGKSYNKNKAIDAYDGTGEDPYEETPKPAVLSNPGYYNATLWQKEVDTSNNPLFKQVFGCSAVAPNIAITKNGMRDPGADDPVIIEKDSSSTPFDQKFNLYGINAWEIELGDPITSGVTPASGPTVSIDSKSSSTDPDSTTSRFVHFGIPNPWGLATGTTTIIDPGATGTSGPRGVVANKDNSNKQINFFLPKAWGVKKGVGVGKDSQDQPTEAINSGLAPVVLINKKEAYATGDTESSGTDVENTYIHFGIPKPWEFIASATSLATDANPTVEIKNIAGSTTHKEIALGLPYSTVFTNPSFNFVGSAEASQAAVTLTYTDASSPTKHTARLNFTIPQGSRIWNGGYLDEYGPTTAIGSSKTIDNTSSATARQLLSLSILPGDIYIATKFGMVWTIDTVVKSGSTITSCVVTNKGVVALPLPQITVAAVNPYDANGNPITSLTGESSYISDSSSPTSWGLSIDVPKAPSINATGLQIVPSTNTMEQIEVIPSNGTLTIKGKIPKGTRIIYGTFSEMETVAHDTGDYFLDTNNYNLYYFTSSGNQYVSLGTLQGPSFKLLNPPISLYDGNLTPYSGDDKAKITQYLNYIYGPSGTIPEGYPPLPNEGNEVLQVIYTNLPDAQSEPGPDTIIKVFWFSWNGVNFYGTQISATSGGSIIVPSTVNVLTVTSSQLGDPDNLVFSANHIITLRTDVNSKITTNSNNISSLNTAVATKITATDATNIVKDALTWGTWSYNSETGVTTLIENNIVD